MSSLQRPDTQPDIDTTHPIPATGTTPEPLTAKVIDDRNEPRSVSRRKWLASAGIFATVWIAGSGSERNGHPPAAPSAAPSTSAAPPATPPTTAAPPPPPPRPTHSPLPPQQRPVFTLADYRRIVPGPAFPAHAIALTIDDGPHPVWTPKILSLLERYHVQATFCLIGNQVRGHEPVARSVVAAGHQLANHTWSHPTKLPKFTPAEMHREIEKAQDKIYSTTSQAPRLFRSPGGAWSPALFAQAAAAGMTPIDWTDDPKDWKRPGTAAIVQRMLAVKSGQIMLCHDGGGDRSQTYAALKQVIPALLARGHTFVAL
jgi:peptidoglycan/xylan/chitin deacetylase (PgdA/CDA1 family)